MNNNYIPVPNQKNITIHKIRSNNKEYSVVNLKANKNAIKDLSYSAYMLYMYFCINADLYSFWLSMKCVCNNTALTRSTYYSALKELEEKGYLYAEDKTFLEFYEDTSLKNDIHKNSKTNGEKSNSTYQKTTEKIKKQRNKENCDEAENETLEFGSRANPQDAPSPATLLPKRKENLFF